MFNFTLQEDLKKLDTYISDTFDVFEEEQEKIKEIYNDFKNKLDERKKILFEEKLKFSIEQLSHGFEHLNELIRKMDSTNLKCLESLKSSAEITENISKIIMPSEKRIVSKIEDNKENLIENFKKKTTNLENTITNLDKETKKIMSNLKAAILVLEGSKEPIFKKIDKLENEKKNLHNNIKELKAEKQELLNQIKVLKKGGEK